MEGGKGSFKGRSDYGPRKKQTHTSTEMGDRQIPPEIKAGDGPGNTNTNAGKTVHTPTTTGDKQIPPMKANPHRPWASPGD